MTAKNKSLLLLKLVKRQFMDVHELDFVDNQPSFSLIESLLERKKTSISLCSTLDSRNKSANEVSRQLREIHRMDHFLFDEHGAKDLYVGYPFVQGKLIDDSLIRCPLLFFPVELKIENNHWHLQLRQEVEISFNKTFLLAFSHFNQVSFEESFLEFDFEEFPKDSQDFLTDLYRMLENSPIELNFNPQTFEEKLTNFSSFTKNEFQQITETGQLKVFPQAVLGIFPQADSYLVPDYNHLLKNQHIKDLEDFFVSSQELRSEKEIHKTIVSKASQEKELITPYPMDATQERAIKNVKSGSSIVVQGPPGSGKSQLICNLIADYVAHGKSVLVVCQKRAALDVVYERLEEKGYAEFAALIHDFKNDRKATYEKINHQIENLDKFKRENNSLDAIYLERQFSQYSREIDQHLEELEEFKAALFDTVDCGLSAKELYLTSDVEKPRIKMRQEYQHFAFNNHESFLNKLKIYIDYALKLDREGYAWADRVNFQNFDFEDLENIKITIDEIQPFYQDLLNKVQASIHRVIDLEECDWFLEKEKEFKQLLRLLENEKVFQYFQNSLDYDEADYLSLSNRKKNLINSFGENGVESTLENAEIGPFLQKLNEAIELKKQWVKWKKWQLFSKEKVDIQKVLEFNALDNHPEALEILMERLENRMNFEHNISNLADRAWLIEMPSGFDPTVYEIWIDLHLDALRAKEIYQKLQSSIPDIHIQEITYEEFAQSIQSLFETIKGVPERRQEWLKYLSYTQLNLLINKKESLGKIKKSLEADFDQLCEFDKMKESLKTHELSVIEKLEELMGGFDLEETLQVFDNSIRIAWIHHLEAKYPILRAVSSNRIRHLEGVLQVDIEEKRKLCEQIVLMKVRERTYENVEYNRLDNRVTYRDLQHQVKKKRLVWPLRKLIQNFTNELLDLMPCWLASPESVSAIFPMQEMFDLVIFDEASQCFAEKGIPAMYRGKQVVITGDSHQLAPYDLYQPRWEEDYVGNLALEVDSLLDLGSRYVSQIQLTGHYRSRSLDLIDFSNQHFYANQLRMIPQYGDFVSGEAGINYLKVEGTWQQSHNPEEAEQVVSLVKKLIGKGEQNIGVITFNFKQQNLIQDLLEESQVNIPSDLFVKNIENVQGDERDIIIFSVGYAPSSDGKMRMQFGSLNLPKGENRLNVAITRAKQKVYVITSILPHQLHVDETKNEGPKLLKQYLEYAYNVSEGKYQPQVLESKVHHIDWYLRNKVKEKLETQTNLEDQIPFADLVPIKESQFQKSIVLTDDDAYYQSISAKGTHAFVPLILEKKGWRPKRFYSRYFWKSQQAFLEEVARFVN